MSDILCKWLNEELRLSQVVEPKAFAKNFSNGYLIGEVLHKYQLQKDFTMFTKKDTSISKLNNFTRLEPTLQLLGISFNMSTAQDLMQEKHGVATHILYQLYISLEKKKKAQISETVMESIQPAASAGLHRREHEIYSDQLHQLVKRDAELKLQNISQHYEEKCQQWNDRSVMIHPIQQTRQLKVQDVQRMKVIGKVPKPPPYNSKLNLKTRQRQQLQRAQQAQMVQTEIAQFETKRKNLVTCGFASSSSGQPFSSDPSLGSSSRGRDVPGNGAKLLLQSNSKYIQDIRQRLAENEQREKRVDRFLVEQFKAHEAREEARREEQLVKRLTRQTKQEQRLAAQLLQIRRQKEVILENRLFREQQYQQRRERDFQEALEREAALARQAKLERAEEIRKELEFCTGIAVERAQSKHKKHLVICKDILEQIVDLATKVGEYRLLTGNLIPQKQMREWKELLFSGLPLYEPIKGHQPGVESSASLEPVELKKQEILNNQDYDEYTNMVGEWAWREEAGETELPPTNNNILGHVIARLRNMIHQPIVEPSSLSFPHFTLKACVLGKFCSGKTACLAKIAKAHGIYVLSANTLIEEALNAYRKEEKNLQVTEPQEEKHGGQLIISSTSLKHDSDTQEESKNNNNIRLSTRAMQGAAAEEELRKGNGITNELLVDIIVEAIRQIPAQSGWILDGFPSDITQAHLLEKALGGSVDVGNDLVSNRMNLVADPNPPKPPPPPAPVLDLALLLDMPDECVITRAFSHTDADADANADANADADADTTAATTSSPTDKTLYLAQIPHRITAFQDTWSELEDWFGGKQNILVHVAADVDEEELYKRVESVLQQVMMRVQQACVPPPEDVELNGGKAQNSSSSATPPSVDQPPDSTDTTPGPTLSHSSLNVKEAESLKSLSKSNTHSPRGHSASKASPSSMTNEDHEGVPKNPPESASACPDSSSWVYVDEPLPPVMPEYLCSHWDAMCNSYVNNIKTVMQQLRTQRTVMNHHLYNISEDYKHYLTRPDLKQELVSQWQKDFNSIPDDMREHGETKTELHMRLEQLCEHLWDLSDKRKEEDEKERAALMDEGWLEDHTAILINHHSTLMQVELDRFQATLGILRVYYLSMDSRVLPELPSNLACISLLDSTEIKDQNESTDPVETSMDDGEDKRKAKSTPHLLRRPDSQGEVSKTKVQGQTESVQPPHEKLISDYEEAITAISKLMLEEAQQDETEEQRMSLPKKSAKTSVKRKQSSKKQKGSPSPSPKPSPAPVGDNSHDQEAKNQIFKEYAAALDHEENRAKVRIALVKGHGLVLVDSLQNKAEQTLHSMQKWLEAHYLAEMKSIDQLIEVTRHHIEAGTKLQNDLVLEGTDFYLSRDCYIEASPPPRPPTVEKPLGSTPTTTQLESLFQQLCTVAPSGLISSSEFFSFLTDIVSINTSSNTLPEPWFNTSETQLMEIVSVLRGNSDLIDWRQFLLSAALPWPFPSLTQLLAVLQSFKAADTGHTGYMNEQQYLQTEMWFSNEGVQPVPEDPSEPLPYDRLANLRKFFFKLFADHSVSPPRLDYVSVLQYFAADPNPRQGFIRALSVVLGQPLRHSSPGHLIKSMPCIEEAIELSSSELDADYNEDESPCTSSTLLREQEVSMPALLAVIGHKVTKVKDEYSIPSGCPSQEEHTECLVHTFRDLGYKPEDCVPFSVLSQHHFIQSLMETSTQYQLVNIHTVLMSHQDQEEANSLTVS